LFHLYISLPYIYATHFLLCLSHYNGQCYHQAPIYIDTASLRGLYVMDEYNALSWYLNFQTRLTMDVDA